MSINPFEWYGPPYLVFYTISACGSALVGWAVKQQVLGKLAGDSVITRNEAESLARQLTPYEAANLRGGSERVFLTACATLARHNLISIDTKKRTVELPVGVSNLSIPSHLHPVEAVIMQRVKGGAVSVDTLKTTLSAQVSVLESSLRAKGLIPDNDEAALCRLLPFLIVAITLTVLALPKIVIGSSLGKPVAFLTIAFLVDFLLAMLFLTPKAETTAKGDAVLAAMNSTGSALQLAFATGANKLSLADTAFAYALFGSIALATDPYSQASQALLKPVSSGGCGGGSGCGSGGCGGGGCGGGCGGCGG